MDSILKDLLTNLLDKAYAAVPGTLSSDGEWADITEDEAKDLDALATHISEARELLRHL